MYHYIIVLIYVLMYVLTFVLTYVLIDVWICVYGRIYVQYIHMFFYCCGCWWWWIQIVEDEVQWVIETRIPSIGVGTAPPRQHLDEQLAEVPWRLASVCGFKSSIQSRDLGINHWSYFLIYTIFGFWIFVSNRLLTDVPLFLYHYFWVLYHYFCILK